jgi:type IV pilus assembly protein PilO
MPKNSKLVTNLAWKGVSVKDPRVLMRALIGALLVANLVAAVIAFKPFGGSADDLRQDQARLSAQLRQLQGNLDSSKHLVEKIEIARTQGDEFLAKYIMDRRSSPAIALEEMHKAAMDAGTTDQRQTYSYDDVEGSNDLQKMSILQGFEGTYANLTKLVNLLDKSQRFWIIDTMQLKSPQTTNAPQGGTQNLNVTLKVITFVRVESGAAL